MSDLVLAAVIGPSDRNTGRPRYADVVAHLYVGGAGMWQVHRLRTGADESADPRRVRIASTGQLSLEIAAGFAIATNVNGAVAQLEELLGHAWSGDDLELDDHSLSVLASLVADLDVAMVLTQLEASDTPTDAMGGPRWSVVVAEPAIDARRTQWDGALDMSQQERDAK